MAGTSAVGGAAGGGVLNTAGASSGAVAGSIDSSGGSSAGSTSGGSGGATVAGTSFVGAGGDADGGMGGSAEGGAGAGGAADGGAGGSDDAPFEGRCGEGWAAKGAASRPALEGSVAPEVDKSSNYSFSFGRYRFVVSAARGGRIVEFSIDGINLIDPGSGSTFWPSPQQAYPWPPPTEIDSDPYAAVADATSLSLTGDVAKSVGLRARKRFWVNAASAVVSIEYRLVNEAKTSAAWAPWEMTRVRAGGYTFAPQGPGNRVINQDSWQYPLPLTLLSEASAAHGIQWLSYPSLTLTHDNYIAEFDGAEGWLAHANRLGKPSLPILFVKSFDDAADASLPDNQAEIQLWTSGTAKPKLLEIEEQGSEQQLAPGESLTWTVRWSACELAADIPLARGSAELVALARAHAVGP